MTTSINMNLEANIDLNSVFSLQYNFDLLKTILESLLKSQKLNNQKISDFESKLEEKDKKISQMQSDLEYFNIYFKNIQESKLTGNSNNLNFSNNEAGNSNQDLLMTIMVINYDFKIFVKNFCSLFY